MNILKSPFPPGGHSIIHGLYPWPDIVFWFWMFFLLKQDNSVAEMCPESSSSSSSSSDETMSYELEHGATAAQVKFNVFQYQW